MSESTSPKKKNWLSLLPYIFLVIAIITAAVFYMDKEDAAGVNADLQAQLEATQVTLSEKEEAVAGAIQELETVKATFETEKTGLEASIASLTEEKAASEATATSLSAEKATLEATVTSLNTEKTALEANVTSLTADKTAAEAKVTSLETEKKTLGDSITALEAEKKDLEDLLAAAKTEGDTHKSAKEVAEGALSSLTIEFDTLTQTAADQISTLEKQLEDSLKQLIAPKATPTPVPSTTPRPTVKPVP